MAAPSDVERPAEAGRFPKDLIVGLVLLVGCAITYWITLGFGTAPPALAQNVQPATFPRMVIGVIAALTLLMMALGLKQRAKRKDLPAPQVAITALAMLAFVLSFETLGILLSMAVFCFVMPLLWGERRYLPLIIFAIAFPTLIWVVFVVFLGVYFEPGVVASFFERLFG